MPKILIVEDEIDIAKVINKRLVQAGFETIIATEGYQAMLLAHKERIDLIVLDLMLPAGDGLYVLKNLRLSGNTMNIPVVVLTGKKDPEYKKEILNQGVEAYLEKPYDPEMLINTIKNLIKKS